MVAHHDAPNSASMPKSDTTPEQPHLNVRDSRTGKSYVIPIQHNAISAIDFKAIRAPENKIYSPDQDDQGLRLFDPGYQNTAVSESQVTYVNGNQGTIQYRGYDIEELYGKYKFADTAFLLIWGHLPSQDERRKLEKDLNPGIRIPQSALSVIRSFPQDAPPISMIMGGLAALQSTQKELIPAHAGKNLYHRNQSLVDQQILQVMSSLSQVTAAAYCHHTGAEFRDPDPSLSYIENMLWMMSHVDAATGKPNPKYVQYLERLWMLVADHEMTCSTAAFLHAASSLPDAYSCLISAISASQGILHAGAIEVAYKNVEEVGSVENVGKKIERIKAGKERLYGYGHRLYKTIDPRATFIRQVLQDLDEEVKKDPLLEVAMEIDRAASEDEYFIKRNLHPNADLFASFAYKAMGFPVDFIHPLSIVARTQGFMAHWREAMDGTPRIWRPQQIYTGSVDVKLG